MRAKRASSTRQVKKPAVRRPDVRTLKIQPKYRKNRWSESTYSEIKLCGNWLTRWGFQHGHRVSVTTLNGLLIIRPVGE